MKTIHVVSIAMLCMAIVLVSCSGEDGEQGPKGDKGDKGESIIGDIGAPGDDGINCWDLNGNGVGDITDDENNEDINLDNVVDALDCQGDDGINCWDLNGNGVGDITDDENNEDINLDNVVDALDCQGEDGEDGNANVQSFSIDIADWEGGSTIPFDIPIDADVRANYAFLFYMQFKDVNNNVIHAVPGINPLASSVTNGVFYHNHATSPNASIFFVNTSDGSSYDFPGDLYERIIIVAVESPGFANKSNADTVFDILKAHDIDVSNYSEVAKYFGLE